MTPVVSAVVLCSLASCVIALYAWRVRAFAARHADARVLGGGTSASTAFEGMPIAGD